MCDVSIPNGDAEKGFSKLSESEPEFCIDAGSYGNVARYINHSCEPNLFVQCVLSSHHDVRLARVVLFAADNIPPLQASLSRSHLCLLLIYLRMMNGLFDVAYAGTYI